MDDDIEGRIRSADELELARATNPTAETEEAAARAAIELGRVLEANNRVPEATLRYEKVWDYRIRHESVLQHAAHAAHNLGWLRSEAGQTEEARTWHERAYALRDSGPAAPEAARLSFLLAVVCLMMLHRRLGNEQEVERWSDCLDCNLWTIRATDTSDPPLELTPAQKERLQAFLSGWVEEGRTTRPADRDAAERGIERMYALGRRRRPHFVWCDSPAECLTHLNHHGLTVGRQHRIEQLVPQAWYYFWAYIRSQLRRSLKNTPLDKVLDVAWRHWNSIGSAIWEELGESGRPGALQFRRRHGASMHEQRGPHDIELFAAELFCRDELGVRFYRESRELMDCWQRVHRSCGFWWPFEEVCFLCERPSALHVDARGRLHSQDGYAIAFRDGFAFCAWHGQRIPAEWILHRDRVAPSVALTWPNIEQRRALSEIIGPERLLSSLPHTTIDTDPDPQIGTLLRIALPDAPAAQFLRVRCATGREFFLRVPPEVTTARQANAWTYGLDADQYTLEVRT